MIDTNQLDYVRNPEDLRWIENRIRQALQVRPFQPELTVSIDDNSVPVLACNHAHHP